MNAKVKCPFCNEMVDILGRSYDLPLWDSSKAEADQKNTDEVILIHCKECDGVLGSYKSDKSST